MALGRWVSVMVSMTLGCTSAATAPREPRAAATATPAPATSAASSPPPRAPAPGEKAMPALAQRLAARIRELLPGARVELRDDSELRIWPKGGKAEDESVKVFLDNLRSRCTDADSCDAAIEHFARGVADYSTGGDQKLALESILPTLKTAAYVSQATKDLSDDARLLAVPVVDDLRLVLVLDLPTTTRFLSEKDRRELGLTLDQLKTRALDNLRRRPRNFMAQELAPGLFGLTAGDGYDSALFLLHDEWRAFKPKVRGELVVAPVARDMVFVTGDQESAALTALAGVLANERVEPQAPYPIAPRAYRWTPSGWAPFEPR